MTLFLLQLKTNADSHQWQSKLKGGDAKKGIGALVLFIGQVNLTLKQKERHYGSNIGEVE